MEVFYVPGYVSSLASPVSSNNMLRSDIPTYSYSRRFKLLDNDAPPHPHHHHHQQQHQHHSQGHHRHHKRSGSAQSARSTGSTGSTGRQEETQENSLQEEDQKRKLQQKQKQKQKQKQQAFPRNDQRSFERIHVQCGDSELTVDRRMLGSAQHTRRFRKCGNGTYFIDDDLSPEELEAFNQAWNALGRSDTGFRDDEEVEVIGDKDNTAREDQDQDQDQAQAQDQAQDQDENEDNAIELQSPMVKLLMPGASTASSMENAESTTTSTTRASVGNKNKTNRISNQEERQRSHSKRRKVPKAETSPNLRSPLLRSRNSSAKSTAEIKRASTQGKAQDRDEEVEALRRQLRAIQDRLQALEESE